MTDAKVLADALVEAGIGSIASGTHHPVCYFPPMPVTGFLHAEEFITDWQVAGKVLEECDDAHLFWDDVDFGCVLRVGIGITKGQGSVDGYDRVGLPRAIIEAWYEVQNND